MPSTTTQVYPLLLQQCSVRSLLLEFEFFNQICSEPTVDQYSDENNEECGSENNPTSTSCEGGVRVTG